VPQYVFKKGENRLDIIPYRISNPKNPDVTVNGFKVGELNYFQQLEIHRNIGVNNNEYLCSKRMFGEPCAICDAQIDKYNSREPDIAKKMYPQTRAVYNVIDLDEPEKGIQVLDVAYNWFEKPLREIAAMKSKRDNVIVFGDWEIGKTIVCLGMPEKFGKKEFFKPANFTFEDRAKPYDESICDKAYKIDQWYQVPDYDVVQADYLQSGNLEPEEQSDNKDTQNVEELTEEFKQMNNIVDEPVVENVPENFKGDELPEEKPSERRGRRREEEKKPEFVCPYKHVAGVDFDNHKDCENCKADEYDTCGEMWENSKK